MRVRRHSIRQQVGHPPRLVTAELMSSRASCYHSVEERRGLRECPSFHFAVMIKFALLDTSTKTEGTKRDTRKKVDGVLQYSGLSRRRERRIPVRNEPVVSVKMSFLTARTHNPQVSITLGVNSVCTHVIASVYRSQLACRLEQCVSRAQQTNGQHAVFSQPQRAPRYVRYYSLCVFISCAIHHGTFTASLSHIPVCVDPRFCL